ncbi:hypothetical protein PUN28_018331 [Cardiocondyla obscurior]|uniref:Uncharacterized protein n=1 Tax=Cardiocondyla obscurior TaxID=286306 RepID=A0AAW2EHX0_9HYME
MRETIIIPLYCKRNVRSDELLSDEISRRFNGQKKVRDKIIYSPFFLLLFSPPPLFFFFFLSFIGIVFKLACIFTGTEWHRINENPLDQEKRNLELRTTINPTPLSLFKSIPHFFFIFFFYSQLILVFLYIGLAVTSDLSGYEPRGWRLQSYGPPDTAAAYRDPLFTTTTTMRTTTAAVKATTTPRTREPTTAPSEQPEDNFEANPALAIANSFAFNRPVYVYNTFPKINVGTICLYMYIICMYAEELICSIIKNYFLLYPAVFTVLGHFIDSGRNKCNKARKQRSLLPRARFILKNSLVRSLQFASRIRKTRIEKIKFKQYAHAGEAADAGSDRSVHSVLNLSASFARTPRARTNRRMYLNVFTCIYFFIYLTWPGHEQELTAWK